MVHFGAICKHLGLHSSKELEIQVLDWHFLNCSGLGLLVGLSVSTDFFFVYIHQNTWRCCWTRFGAVGGIPENRIDTTCSNLNEGNTTSSLFIFIYICHWNFSIAEEDKRTVCNKIQCYNVLQQLKNNQHQDSPPLIRCED